MNCRNCDQPIIRAGKTWEHVETCESGCWGSPILPSDQQFATPTWEDYASLLREAAKWFDLIDKLLDRITVEESQGSYRLIDKIQAGREIQDDLLSLAGQLEFL